MPTAKTVPSGELYENVPGTSAVALSCAALSGVPFTIGAGAAHDSVGFTCLTVIATASDAPA